MQEKEAGRPARCLFVISDDFGELGFAYSLLAGRRFTGDALVLLPEHLVELNADSLPFENSVYRSIDDIRDHTEQYQPDLVWLLSGPLLLLHSKGISFSDMKQWLKTLRAGGCRVITTDPFLGIAASFKPWDFSPEALGSNTASSGRQRLVNSLAVKARQLLIAAHFRRSQSLLKSADKVFAMPVDHLKGFRKSGYLGFWNPALVNSISAAPSTQNPVCLFVIAKLDYEIQVTRVGQQQFVEWLKEKLVQVRDAGRQPILLGPADLLSQLRERLDDGLQVTLVSAIPFMEFQALLVNAEHVFYWNMISHSMYMRLIMGKPFHFFAKGHLSYMIPRWHERAIKTYYDGNEPLTLDLAEPLDFDRLDKQASVFRRQTGNLLQRMQEFPSPDRLVENMLAR